MVCFPVPLQMEYRGITQPSRRPDPETLRRAEREAVHLSDEYLCNRAESNPKGKDNGQEARRSPAKGSK
jgi:hypothetical protein